MRRMYESMPTKNYFTFVPTPTIDIEPRNPAPKLVRDWWGTVVYIRTKQIFNFVQGHGFCMIPEIVGEQNFIIIHIHGVQKCIDYFPLIGLVVDAAVFEAADPFDDFFLGEHWLRHLGADQADVQLLFLTFQFFHSLLCGGRKNAGFNRFQQIFKAFVTHTELFFDRGNHRILLSLYGNNGISHPVNDFICEDLGHSLHNHRPFQPIPLECFPFAGMPMLGVDTFVVVIERSVPAFPHSPTI